MKVMKKAPSLYGKQDEEGHFKYYIRPLMPEAFKAIRDQYLAEIKQYKSENATRSEDEPKTNFYFNGEKFYVNGEVVEEDVKPPTFRTMLSLSEEIIERMEKIEFASGGPIDENNSIFQSFATNVETVEDIDLAYMRIRQVKPYADHIILVYRLKNTEEFKYGGSNDREYYGDQEILKIIKYKHAVNLAVFVTREYGGVPLGPKRFEIIRNIATQAIEDLEPEIISADDEPPTARLFNRTKTKKPFRGRNSGQGGRGGGNGRGGYSQQQGRGDGGWRGRGRRGH